ncbi:MAG TPA: ATP-grasp domain-containing protein [Acidimicrobiales bacterium]|nr:ATP-grasp domain-containing protein [Acidimicrobiales bacterium]
MRVLLSDGSGLTARQCAGRLHAAGHHVEVLSPDPFCLCRFTRNVARVRRVPAFGPDPLGWLDVSLEVYRTGGFDVLLPTPEQVAVLSWASARLDAAGVATVVPPFSALTALQDKVSASATLTRLGIPQPVTATAFAGWSRFPAFVKDPVGTASGGVKRVTTKSELENVAAGRSVVIQAAVDGPLVMCQSVFDHGRLIAFHANQRTGEGVRGGASHKLSLSVPEVRRWFEVLGADLQWHGALSADVVLATTGPSFIDVNPRLVEPENAFLSGVDLVGAMLELAGGGHPALRPESRSEVATHQFLLAVLGAAQDGQRRAIAAEIAHAARRTGDYRGSREELTPLRHDPLSAVPVALAVVATVAVPSTWSWFATGSVSNYALTGDGWRQLRESDPPAPEPTGGELKPR